MKKLKTLITAALCLCAVCALSAAPAHALEYSFSAPSGPEYGKSTAFEPMATADGGAMRNEDLSKSAALIPPGFGTPTSCLLGSGEYLTPNLVPSQMAGAGMVNGSTASVTLPSSGTVSGAAVDSSGYPTVSSGVTTGSSGVTVDSNGFPTVNTGVSGTGGSYIGFTEVTGAMYYSDGSLGTIKIPSIGLTVGVYEGAGDASMLKGAGHFEETSIWQTRFSAASRQTARPPKNCPAPWAATPSSPAPSAEAKEKTASLFKWWSGLL